MRYKRFIFASVIALFGQAQADVSHDDFTQRPGALNLEFERDVLRTRFPLFRGKNDTSGSTISAIRFHFRQLDVFRRDWLAGLQLKLELQCERVRGYKNASDNALTSGKIGKEEHLARMSFVTLETAQCSKLNKKLSPFWQLHEHYMLEYERELRELKKMESRCISQQLGREGKN